MSWGGIVGWALLIWAAVELWQGTRSPTARALALVWLLGLALEAFFGR